MPSAKNENGKKYNILLLTNRDSDNTGDQILEACDISLVSVALKNLGLSSAEYVINSRALGIVKKAYLATGDEKHLETANNLIKAADLVIIGGTPVFNYTYQNFYERTAITVELCKKYNVPIIFSAVGIEYFDESNEKCQRIMESANYDVVRQITTRDDFDSLKRIKKREDLVISKVSDPAVFSRKVMRRFKSPKNPFSTKTIGLVVLRGDGFSNNGYDFSAEGAGKFWCGLKKALEEKGYRVIVFTNGFFEDEAFLQKLVKTYKLPAQSAVFNTNKPEDFMRQLTKCDGVVATRLHPSIISYSLGIPSVGLKWNMKVSGFYEGIGYENRVIEAKDITVDTVLTKLEEAMKEGVSFDSSYAYSVYETLYMGIANALHLPMKPIYSYGKLLRKLPAFKGTTKKEADLKIQKKLRRTYEGYNYRAVKVRELKHARDKQNL